MQELCFLRTQNKVARSARRHHESEQVPPSSKRSCIRHRLASLVHSPVIQRIPLSEDRPIEPMGAVVLAGVAAHRREGESASLFGLCLHLLSFLYVPLQCRSDRGHPMLTRVDLCQPPTSIRLPPLTTMILRQLRPRARRRLIQHHLQPIYRPRHLLRVPQDQPSLPLRNPPISTIMSTSLIELIRESVLRGPIRSQC